MKPTFIFFALFSFYGTYGQTISRTDTLPSGEIMLHQEILIEKPVELVWQAFTQPHHWQQWVTPVVAIDFKINGTIQSHYDATATIGDSGTIVLHIPFYIPEKQIVMQAELSNSFPAFMKAEEKNLYSVYHFEQLTPTQTKLTLYGIGYKNEEKWQKLLSFFIQGNEQTLHTLKSYLEGL